MYSNAHISEAFSGLARNAQQGAVSGLAAFPPTGPVWRGALLLPVKGVES